ncbi:MAG: protoheme IX farnesyltransferase [Rhizobiales bacterium]|nr:protoheme IX farnesyltransferase [Hyphomicrobiales bacterium]
MSDRSTTTTVSGPQFAELGDYLALLKPRVMSLVVFTALVGMVVAPGDTHPIILGTALLAIAFGAGASGALNMWYDADIDGGMSRTALRPIPRGRVTAEEALTLGVVLSIISVMTLGLVANWTAAALLAITIGFYLFVYTIWLKRSTPQNIVIGGAAGAFPPMIGWAVQTGSIGIESIVLFLIIFMRTPPHFWALALYRCRDYEAVGVPMLPVVAGPDETRRQILIYSVLLAPLGVAPWLLGFAGPAFAVVAAALGAVFVWLALRVYRIREGHAGDAAARRLFRFSLLYLFAIFAALLVERLVISAFEVSV